MECNFQLPQLTEVNYAYWKSRTKAYLRAQGQLVRCTIIADWDHLTKLDGDDETILKPEIEWTTKESELG